MIETVHIENYKSIHSLDVPLGRVTVLIGENGCGKSNILEAIALAAAASQDKLDNEFLAVRGIRISSPTFMRNASITTELSRYDDIKIEISNHRGIGNTYILSNDNKPYSKWEVVSNVAPYNFQAIKELQSAILETTDIEDKVQEIKNEWEQLNAKIQSVPSELLKKLFFWGLQLGGGESRIKFLEEKVNNQIMISEEIKKHFEENNIELLMKVHNDFCDYLIYSPENRALRTFEKEAQIEPLGINGEGLYKLLKFTSDTEPEKIKVIKEHLALIAWFEDFELPESQFGNFEIVVKDKYIKSLESEFYNHKNTNEGFLFLLFYILLFVSDKTPSFFAIDNIDASLNPKLCTEMTKSIVKLAKEHNKQVILTTHNPAILDGINLHDDEQKILIVSRNSSGHTKVRNLKPPKVAEGEVPIKLSEAFLNGMIGGLPQSF